ncbi:hypothetical protein ACSDQ9_10470 [Aestuariimicrobium soli]|uniref:hypothetical protein n=1 Tax=Aestuariimicrobium soli TaxID=2035834 RepID=UPI003EBA95E8
MSERVTAVSTTTDRAATLMSLVFLAGLVVAALNLAAAAARRDWGQGVVALAMFALFALQASLWRGARVSRLAWSDDALYRLSGAPVSAATGWRAGWDEITHAGVHPGSAGPVLAVQVTQPPRMHLSRWLVGGVPKNARTKAYLCQLDPDAVPRVEEELARHGIRPA